MGRILPLIVLMLASVAALACAGERDRESVAAGGGTTTTNQAGSAGSGAIGSGGTGANGSGGSGAQGGAAGAGGASLPPCEYPAEPYGVSPGEVLSPQLLWTGYAAGSSEVGTVPITDFYDCHGSRGISSLFIDVVAITCGACQSLASEMSSRLPAWAASGIHVITIMGFAQNTIENVTAWRETYGLQSSNVVLDAPECSVNGSSSSSPLTLLVDPRTMTIQQRWSGLGDASIADILAAVELLAQQNAP